MYFSQGAVLRQPPSNDLSYKEQQQAASSDSNIFDNAVQYREDIICLLYTSPSPRDS